jgi:hypothetical protein
MIEKAKGRTYTVSDLYTEAAKMVKEEFSSLKNRPLNQSEEIKMKELARLISNTVLKEMKIV